MTHLSTSELADHLGVSAKTIRRLARQGDLTPVRLTPRSPLRFSPSEVEHLEGRTMGARYNAELECWTVDFWYVFPDGTRKRYRRKAPVNSKRGALRYEQEMRREIQQGTFREAQPITWASFMDELSGWLDAQDIKPATRKRYDRSLTHLGKRFARHALTTIDTKEINKYRADCLKQGLAPKSVNVNLGVLSRVFEAAIEHGHIDIKPRFKNLKLPDRELRWLSQTEAKRLLGACPDRLRAMVTLALHTGLRLGELEALRWSDVDFDTSRLTVRQSYCADAKAIQTTKTGKHRTVPLDYDAIEALRKHPERLRCPLVFSTASGGVIDKPDLSRELRRACKKAEIEPCGWHVLRHTYASWLVQAGVSLYQVQNFLGHSSPMMTQQYAHLSPDIGHDAVALLPRLGNI